MLKQATANKNPFTTHENTLHHDLHGSTPNHAYFSVNNPIPIYDLLRLLSVREFLLKWHFMPWKIHPRVAWPCLALGLMCLPIGAEILLASPIMLCLITIGSWFIVRKRWKSKEELLLLNIDADYVHYQKMVRRGFPLLGGGSHVIRTECHHWALLGRQIVPLTIQLIHQNHFLLLLLLNGEGT